MSSSAFDQAADLVIGLLQETCEHLSLAREEAPLVIGQRVPILDVFRLVGQLRIRRNDAHLLLPLDRFLPNPVPALVELSLVLVRPLLGNMMWCMDGAGGVIHEERLVRCHRLLSFHPVDRLVGHVDGEMVILHWRRIDLGHTVVDERIPLIGFAPDEAVELVETLVGGPAVEWARHAGLPGGRLVPLAERTGAVTVESEHFSQWRNAVRNLPGVAGESCSSLHDGTGVGGVMVPTGLECVPRR